MLEIDLPARATRFKSAVMKRSPPLCVESLGLSYRVVASRPLRNQGWSAAARRITTLKVRPQLPHDADVQFNMKKVALVFVALVVVSFAFRFWRHEPSLPVAIHPSEMVAVSFEQAARRDFASRLREIIARANSSGDKIVFGKTTIVYDTSINAPPLRLNEPK
ncbi:MAG: hypothetical protein ACYDH9_04410 [Limisphaerales bacterium]